MPAIYDRVLRNHTFYDHSLDLTGRDIKNCIFDGCIVAIFTHKGGLPQSTNVVSCTFEKCMHVGDGWPWSLGATK